jgi:glycosyltransferase involved in cell wall biosynthesis
MKVVLLTQYFPPETGAPQNRLFATAKALQRKGAQVTVLTAMPNYPDMRVHQGYRGRWMVREQMEGLAILRSWIFVTRSRSILARLLNYFSFVLSSLIIGTLNLRKSDVLFVESPPLFLGVTALWLARIKGAKLVFNVSDLWPESAVQLGLVTNPLLVGLSTQLELMCYRKSALITGQTQGIVANIQQRCPGKRVCWVPNGVDLVAMAQFVDNAKTEHPFGHLRLPAHALVFAYAGIIGHAQGLDVILRAAALLGTDTPVHFLLIGDGPERERLMAIAKGERIANVHFVQKMPRSELVAWLSAVSGVVVPLKKNDLFKGAIPSKIFEALALSKPILLGVEGEAKKLFINEGGAGLAFAPEDPEDLARQVRRYAADRSLLATHGASGLRYARMNFDRERISERLWEELTTMLGQQ